MTNNLSIAQTIKLDIPAFILHFQLSTEFYYLLFCLFVILILQTLEINLVFIFFEQ